MTGESIDDVLFCIQSSNKGPQPMIEIRMKNGEVLMANTTIDEMERMYKEMAIVDRMKW